MTRKILSISVVGIVVLVVLSVVFNATYLAKEPLARNANANPYWIWNTKLPPVVPQPNSLSVYSKILPPLPPITSREGAQSNIQTVWAIGVWRAVEQPKYSFLYIAPKTFQPLHKLAYLGELIVVFRNAVMALEYDSSQTHFYNLSTYITNWEQQGTRRTFDYALAWDIAAAYATAQLLIPITDFVTNLDEVNLWLPPLESPFNNYAGTGIVGGLILTLEEKFRPIHSAGIDISDIGDISYNLLAFYRYSGLPEGYVPAYTPNQLPQRVWAVTHHTFAVPQSIYQQIGGFRSGTDDTTIDYDPGLSPTNRITLQLIDFCIRLWMANYSVYYTSDSVVVISDDSYETAVSPLHSGIIRSNLVLATHSQWARRIERAVVSRYELPPHSHSLNWRQLAIGCSGMAEEATRVLMSLYGRIRVRVSTPGSACMSGGSDVDIATHVVQAIARMRLTKFDGPPKAVVLFPWLEIQHMIEALQSETHVDNADPGRPLFRVARFIAETDAVPPEVVAELEFVDEVWVPASFLVHSLANSNVARNKVYVIPEPIDHNYFNPALWRPFAGLGNPRRLDPEQPFTFLSIFKWEGRKNPEMLIRAFLDEFAPNENVRLVLITYLFGAAVKSDAKGARDPHAVAQLVQKAAGNHSLDPLDKRKIISITRALSSREIIQVYKSADCYVTATHAEGWGLPIMEAATMEVPVIATNWSGHTDFLPENGAFLIRVDGLVDAIDDISSFKFYGKWAQPSAAHLRQLMRHVIEHYHDDAIPRAMRARNFIAENFSFAKVGSIMIERLRQMEYRRTKEVTNDTLMTLVSHKR